MVPKLHRTVLGSVSTALAQDTVIGQTPFMNMGQGLAVVFKLSSKIEEGKLQAYFKFDDGAASLGHEGVFKLFQHD